MNLKNPILLATFLLLSFSVYPQQKGGLSKDKVLPFVVFAPKPQYPGSARAVQAAGIVRIDVKFNPDGKIVSANFVEGHDLLRESTLEAARKWRFNKVDKSIGLRGVRLSFVYFRSADDFIETEQDDVIYRYRIHLMYVSDHLRKPMKSTLHSLPARIPPILHQDQDQIPIS